MGKACSACGAQQEADSPVCVYCGAVLRTVSADEELEAVEAVCAVARKIAGERVGLLSMIGTIYGFTGKQDRLSALWSAAFIPNTPAAQLKMLQQVLLLTDTSVNFLVPLKSLASQKVNASLMNRAEMLVTLLRSHSSAVKGADPALRTGEALYNLTSERVKRARRTLVLVLFGPLILLVGVAMIAALFAAVG
jgi:hypothetical protein